MTRGSAEKSAPLANDRAFEMPFCAAGLAARHRGRKVTGIKSTAAPVSRSPPRHSGYQNHQGCGVTGFSLPYDRQIEKLLSSNDGPQVGAVGAQKRPFGFNLNRL